MAGKEDEEKKSEPKESKMPENTVKARLLQRFLRVKCEEELADETLAPFLKAHQSSFDLSDQVLAAKSKDLAPYAGGLKPIKVELIIAELEEKKPDSKDSIEPISPNELKSKVDFACKALDAVKDAGELGKKDNEKTGDGTYSSPYMQVLDLFFHQYINQSVYEKVSGHRFKYSDLDGRIVTVLGGNFDDYNFKIQDTGQLSSIIRNDDTDRINLKDKLISDFAKVFSSDELAGLAKNYTYWANITGNFTNENKILSLLMQEALVERTVMDLGLAGEEKTTVKNYLQSNEHRFDHVKSAETLASDQEAQRKYHEFLPDYEQLYKAKLKSLKSEDKRPGDEKEDVPKDNAALKAENAELKAALQTEKAEALKKEAALKDENAKLKAKIDALTTLKNDNAKPQDENDKTKDNLDKQIEFGLYGAGSALIAAGALSLAVPGVGTALGAGLMVAGVASLSAGLVAQSFPNKTIKPIREAVENISKVLDTISDKNRPLNSHRYGGG